MTYPIILLWLFGALFSFYLLFWWLRWRRTSALQSQLSQMSFPQAWRACLQRIPHYEALNTQERERIERAVLRFAYMKRFEGVGLEVTDEMRVVTGFYASLMLLHKGEEWLGALEQVLIYAEDFIFEGEREHGGIVSEGPLVLDGQSTPETVVISWEVARDEAYTLTPYNVIIHELAHLLDYMSGMPDGRPPMDEKEREAWEAALMQSYDTLCSALDAGEQSEIVMLFGEEGAEDEAEFFAVASELFFRAPQQLREGFPPLYEALARFYRREMPV